MYQQLIEILYDLGLEEKVFKDRSGLYDCKWRNTLKEAGFLCYSGSSRVVFTHPSLGDWVIKTDYLPNAHYTRREVEKYQEAIDCEMETHFLPVHSLGFFHGHEFFAAPLCSCDEERTSEYLSNGDEELCERILDNSDTEEMLYCAFGEESYDLLTWLNNHEINDIHVGNLGILKDGSVVITDYAGWNLQEVFYED